MSEEQYRWQARPRPLCLDQQFRCLSKEEFERGMKQERDLLTIDDPAKNPTDSDVLSALMEWFKKNFEVVNGTPVRRDIEGEAE